MKMHLEILLVEDDLDTRDFMEVLLTAHGHTLTLAANGQQAVDLAIRDQHPYDLILMDMQMPIMDGIEAVHRLRANPATARVPIVCISAKASGTTEEEALAAGCDVYLVKPCWEEDLLAGMKTALLKYGRIAPEDQLT